MKKLKLIFILIAATFCLISSDAEALIIDALDSGWYISTQYDSGHHNPINQNYFVGRENLYSDINESYHEERNFFVFNLAGISGQITSATLEVYNPQFGFFGGNPEEIYRLVDVTTPAFDLLAGGSMKGEIFEDLGSGKVYGQKTVDASYNGVVINFILNSAAIEDLNNASGSFFSIGGYLPTLTPQGTSTIDETLFAFTGDFETGLRYDPNFQNLKRLNLGFDNIPSTASIPEPSTLLMASLGLFGIIFRKKVR